MANETRRIGRRNLLRGGAAIGVAIPVLGLTTMRTALAMSKKRVNPNSATAKALDYKPDAEQTSRPSSSQSCNNCTHFSGKPSADWGPCTVFNGELVNDEGWCKAWAKKA